MIVGPLPADEWVWLAWVGYEEDVDVEITSGHDLDRAADALRELRPKKHETARDRRRRLQTAP